MRTRIEAYENYTKKDCHQLFELDENRTFLESIAKSPKINYPKASNANKTNYWSEISEFQDVHSIESENKLSKRRNSVLDTDYSKELHTFRQKLVSLIESEPIEDGYEHPAEALIAESLRKSKLAQTWIFSIFREKYKSNPSWCAILLRCIGRLPLRDIKNWGVVMASNGLEHFDVEVREASIRALEMWGGEEAIAILKSHTEPIGWLSKYVDQVIKDLSA